MDTILTKLQSLDDEAIFVKRSMYLTIMYIVLTNKLPTEKPRTVSPEPDASPKPKPKSKPKPTPKPPQDIDMDLDINRDSDAEFEATFTRNKTAKGKAKAIAPNEGPSTKVCHRLIP